MRPWSPDELFSEAVAVAEGKGFAPASAVEACSLDFVEDFPRDGLTSFMHRLEQHEREALYELVDEEIRADISKELIEANEQWRTHMDEFLGRLADRLEQKIDDELHAVARNSVELPIAMAEQILRRAIELDRGAVMKAVETIIFRAKRGTRFTVVAHPDDASFLTEHPEDLELLKITAVEADQRVERGGCFINSEGQEWDYTVGGRFEKLAETVRESILDSVEGGEESP